LFGDYSLQTFTHQKQQFRSALNKRRRFTV